MGDAIWTIVGFVAAIIGGVCFALGSTYDMSFRKLGRYVGAFVYISVLIIMLCPVVVVKDIPVLEKFQSWWLALGGKSIPIPKKFQRCVGAILFVAICSISVVHDKYVTGISDAFTIISYGSFALTSLSMSKKLELGFETGFTNFFLQLFAAQLFKIKWFLMPIALFFCAVIIFLRHCPERSEEQGAGSNTPDKGSHDGPPDTNASPMSNGTVSNSQVSQGMGEVHIQISPQNRNGTVEGNIDRQDYLEMGEVSGKRQLSTNKKQNILEESSEAVGEVSEENIPDGDDDQIVPPSGSLAAGSTYSSEQRHVPSIMATFPPPQLRRRRKRRTNDQSKDGGSYEQNNERTSSLAAGSSYSSEQRPVSPIRPTSPPQLRRSFSKNPYILLH